MPYIPSIQRPVIDAMVDPLIVHLNGFYKTDDMVGRLSYAISKIIWGLSGDEWHNNARTYARLNAIDGVMGLAQAEFRRRIITPYEDQKREVHGDI